MPILGKLFFQKIERSGGEYSGGAVFVKSGRDERQVVSRYPYVGGFDVSRDGSRIAFDSTATKDAPVGGFAVPKVFVAASDGTQVKAVTTGALQDLSADGSRIVLYRDKDEHRLFGRRVFTVRSDGTDLRRVGQVHDRVVGWSPSGKYLALLRGTDFDSQLLLFSVEGRLVRTIRLHASTAGDWSPDGARILVFRRSGLYVHAFRTGSERRLPGRPEGIWPPGYFQSSWSPDARKLAYVADSKKGRCQLFVVRADGRGGFAWPTRECPSWDPTWAPDGKTLAYADVTGVTIRRARGSLRVVHRGRASVLGWTR